LAVHLSKNKSRLSKKSSKASASNYEEEKDEAECKQNRYESESIASIESISDMDSEEVSHSHFY